MAAKFFIALLALSCLLGDSLGTTTTPEQKNTGTTKDLCEVSAEG